jgi:hypothetical protein
MPRWEKHGSTSTFVQFCIYFIQASFSLGNSTYKILSILEVLEFKIWKKKRFGKIANFYNRKKLYLSILDELSYLTSNKSKVNIYEFGVAFGELTKIITKNAKFQFNYNGFDTFSGLPNSWRGLPKGAISAGNVLPIITGDNISFHVGLIEDTISSVDFKSEDINLFIFDFDLYKPTLLTYKFIRKDIKINDVLIFDEAFTSDEKIIIENYFFRDFSYKVIGSSVFAIAFKIEEILFNSIPIHNSR